MFLRIVLVCVVFAIGIVLSILRAHVLTDGQIFERYHDAVTRDPHLALSVAEIVGQILWGPTLVGPVVIWLIRGHLFAIPFFSGENLWIGLGLLLVPEALALCFSMTWPGQVASAALFMLGILGRPFIFSALTAIVCFSSMRASVSGVVGWKDYWSWCDVMGMAFGVAWGIQSIYQLFALGVYGMPK